MTEFNQRLVCLTKILKSIWPPSTGIEVGLWMQNGHLQIAFPETTKVIIIHDCSGKQAVYNFDKGMSIVVLE